MRTGTGTGRRRRAGLRSGVAGLMVGLATVTVAIIPASTAGANLTPVSACPAPVITSGRAVVTCSYTGSDQSWTVPTGVTSATFDVAGAQGGASGPSGGDGGETTAVLAVTAGTAYSVVVGGQGGSVNGCPGGPGGAGGFGGGGAGGADTCPGAGGGGGSSVADAGTLELAAGGGGGSSNCSDLFPAVGGAGGGLTGDYGQAASDSLSLTGNLTGAPGTQSGGGVATGTATSGGPGQGGAGGTQPGCGGDLGMTGGGGGGGGYYGGAGGDGTSDGAGGGGGSGFAAAGLSPTFTTGARSGNGVVTITYSDVTIPGVTVTSATASLSGSAVVGGGGTLSDTATVTSAAGVPTPTGPVTFYFCQVSTSSVLAPGLCPATGTPNDATETLSGSSGSATAASKPFTPTGAGTWCYSVTYAGDSNNLGSSDNATGTADTHECLLVSAASPSIATTPSATTITLGLTPPTLKDTAVLAAGYNPTGTISFTLYNPAGTKIDTESVTVNGNGSYTTTAGYTLPPTGMITGTYQWDASYTSGDVNNGAVSENNAPAEQVKVVSPCGSLTGYLLSATYAAGSFTGLFCVNAAGTGTYSQNGGTAVTGKVLFSGATTAVSASGTGLVLLGQKTTTASSFTETAPAPMKSGTFTLAPLP